MYTEFTNTTGAKLSFYNNIVRIYLGNQNLATEVPEDKHLYILREFKDCECFSDNMHVLNLMLKYSLPDFDTTYYKNGYLYVKLGTNIYTLDVITLFENYGYLDMSKISFDTNLVIDKVTIDTDTIKELGVDGIYGVRIF